jgi:uncharacterized membrane protein
MSTAARPRIRFSQRVHRRIRARQRLLLSAVLGLGVALAIPGPLPSAMRAAIGWDTAIAMFLLLILVMAGRATPASMRARAELEDQTRWAILALMAGAAFFSMFAVLGVLHEAHGAGGRVSVELAVFAGLTILLSWSFAHMIFAVHYAHEFYSAPERNPPGLLFPDKCADPDYWDFLYFSFVIGMTSQVSDVQVATQPWRRLVLAHGIMSFLFNTVILALSINLMAGLL